MNLMDEFLGVIDLLNDARIDYALCGGLAVAFYGYTRFTKEIDLLIVTQDLERIRSLLGTRGFVFLQWCDSFQSWPTSGP